MKYVPLLCCLLCASAKANTYSSSFPLSENPISEDNQWINGGTVGLDWTNIRTIGGVAAVGTQPGNDQEYNDSTAVLAGNWASDQQIQATVYLDNAGDPPSAGEEVELRLRTTISPHSITGYEITCSVSTDPQKTYFQIIRWEGPLGAFTEIAWANYKVQNGDVITAIAQGKTISAYVNGNPVPICSANDAKFLDGSPGIGTWLWGQTGVNANYGFSNVSATDSGALPSPTPSSTPSATPTSTPPRPTPYPPRHLRIIPQ